MKFSESWLREWVNPAISSSELAHQITMAGLEVDAVEAVAGQFTGVLIGEVVECGPHPDADKLQVTKINLGSEFNDGELVDIVCGAKNCRLGLKVAVATVGAVLPGDFKIKKAKLRGVPSHGMLCSESEIGLSDSSDGIMELAQDAPIGRCVREYLDLNDVTIDVDLTANRGDCLGLKGLAREVGVLNSLNITEPEIVAVASTIDDVREITLSAAKACPRYLGRVIKDIDVTAKTPLWMVEKLRRCGTRSIDPVVDVTNYVLLEQGHPMHAFDLSALDGGINVRYATPGEKLVLLDGNEVTLSTETLVIADDNKALAMAGIFGGKESGVKSDEENKSTDIFLESAFFAPLAILGKARQYGLHTDSSHRYERGIDPELQRNAMERATTLLLEIVGGKAGPIVEALSDEHLPKEKIVTLRREKLDGRIGHHIDDTKVTEILTRLGFNVTFESNIWTVVVPAYRFDIKVEVDLIEEVARIFGYNNIPNVSPKATLAMREQKEKSLPLKRLRNVMVNRGYQEAITYSFVDPKVQSLIHPEQEVMTLPHPISSEMSVMRLSMWTGLLQSVIYNQNRQQSRLRLFETGLRFVPDDTAENGVRQEQMFAGVVTGQRNEEHWDMEKSAIDFFDVKSDVEALLALTADASSYEFSQDEIAALHPGQTAAIHKNGVLVGHVGTLHPELERKLGLNGRTFIFELLLSEISTQKIPEAGDISRFPANRRDIAVIVEEKINAKNVLQLIEKVGGNYLVDLNLFDVYRGNGIDEGFKSLAIAMTLQDCDKTLEEKDINEVVERVVDTLETELNASLRN
ncbi:MULTISPECIES: phenylalanine--tRNA ligase subunit beta [unclassified Colwellia]|uniref:phenylalanine--tRNA ligase subunit beta n=1 Tax=unclassified Colwellia TaxID=196834 RepID=UPI0015F6ADEB|nr:MULTISPECIES: phenylalanine--tRNA ligase subunit beta [unclassified Colwellia]MBA6233550.1 phenylalanine--tRNA ligase subunit beta [Colwellia sp. MB02u-7]MBA6238110.1 phenylalanine--tRNA ligase subunit beta [Colwellia sp. MB02u-11]MBA6257339.1 phenylalanine--tRNA ligase subunit beta [Colwellia sp. MB3u-28]MBA6258923.1 phenylalanine--tRNA ligase subunit beta [Colwellia sp. MB3u-41]MBA6299753.1 phenylalanine--tRNA ligase subunit beta [Colwellia sp. MB3u-22]